MRKIILIVLTALLIIGLAACGGRGSSAANPNPATNANPDTFPAKTKLVMATEAGFRPYEYRSDDDINKIVGVDVDIANEIANELGLELEVIDMEFSAVIDNVMSGKSDFGAAGLSISEERLKQVDFTLTYAVSKQVILTKKDSAINGPDDITASNNAVQQGTVADSALSDDYPDNQPMRYNKYFDALSDLQNGRVDCIVLDYMPALELVKTADNFVILDEELFTDEYAICVKKGNTELLDAMNKVLQRLIDEGKIDEFTNSHLQ